MRTATQTFSLRSSKSCSEKANSRSFRHLATRLSRFKAIKFATIQPAVQLTSQQLSKLSAILSTLTSSASSLATGSKFTKSLAMLSSSTFTRSILFSYGLGMTHLCRCQALISLFTSMTSWAASNRHSMKSVAQRRQRPTRLRPRSKKARMAHWASSSQDRKVKHCLCRKRRQERTFQVTSIISRTRKMTTPIIEAISGTILSTVTASSIALI